jgi:metal-sulfur cluster biosynthetic enzyme
LPRLAVNLAAVRVAQLAGRLEASNPWAGCPGFQAREKLREPKSRETTMINNFSEEYIRSEIGSVMHPTIHCSLVELGIVKNIEIKSGRVIITMALPFAEVPDSIKNYLFDSLREAIEEVDAPVEIRTEVMTKEELEKFLAMEKEKSKH